MGINVKDLLFVVLAACVLAVPQFAQSKVTKRPTSTPVPAVTIEPVERPTPTPEKQKRNERPVSSDATAAKNSGNLAKFTPTYFYEFSRPGFLTERVLIEHDATGNGTISFLKKDFDEMMSDPIKLSPATIKAIDETLAKMNFLDSNEDYQYERDFTHLGVMHFTLKKDGRERSVIYNWTTDANAKFLMDEYRRISNEYVWRFDVVVTRENQPLRAPGVLDQLDAYLQRGEISDPPHLVPFLTELSADERLPLMARNHATRLIKQIEKAKK